MAPRFFAPAPRNGFQPYRGVTPMVYVLIVITVFASTNAITNDTRFQEFESQAACEDARAAIETWAGDLKGPVSRNIFAACYPQGLTV